MKSYFSHHFSALVSSLKVGYTTANGNTQIVLVDHNYIN